jgi:hypothetical protein
MIQIARHRNRLAFSTPVPIPSAVCWSLAAQRRECRPFPTGSYKVAQQWSAALKKHPTRPDGIRYRSRHAPERIAYAIYGRSPATFSVTSMGSFTDPANEVLIKRILMTYKFAYV